MESVHVGGHALGPEEGIRGGHELGTEGGRVQERRLHGPTHARILTHARPNPPRHRHRHISPRAGKPKPNNPKASPKLELKLDLSVKS